MKRNILYGLFCLVGLFILTASSFKKKNSRYFSYHAKYEHSNLRLFDNGTFEQYKRSCTYAFRTKGTWQEDGDTLYLEHEKVKWNKHSWKPYISHRYVDRANKLVVLSSDTLQYAFEKEFGLKFLMVLTTD
jgi:hypothetical protein